MNFSQQLLIALPDMQDPRFEKAVILICEHNENGAMGLVLNQPMDLTTQQIFDDLSLNNPLKNHTVMDGGPLNKNCGFILHNNKQLFKSSISIQDQLTLTTSKDLLEQISMRQFSHQWKFHLGYSGWEKNQLEDEIAQNTWLTCPVDIDLIFNTPAEEKWKKALSIIGIKDYKSISGIAHA